MDIFTFLDYKTTKLVPLVFQYNLESLSLVSLFLENFPNGIGRAMHKLFYPNISKSTFSSIGDYISNFLANTLDLQRKGKELSEWDSICIQQAHSSCIKTANNGA